MRARCRVTRPRRTRGFVAALAVAGGVAGAALSGGAPVAMACSTLAGLAAGASLGVGSLLFLIYAPVGWEPPGRGVRLAPAARDV